jgi:hypothetical protein
VLQNINQEIMKYMNCRIQALSYLYFIVDELDPEITGQNKLLYIKIQCIDVLIGNVLVDNDSILNMLPTHML